VTALALWPLKVRHFESSAIVVMRYESNDANSQAALKSLVGEVMAEELAPSSLDPLCREIAGIAVPDNHAEADRLLTMCQNLRVSTAEGRSPQTLAIRITLVGKGMPTETELVNQLSNRLVGRLPHQWVAAQIRHEVAQLETHLQSTHARFQDLQDAYHEQIAAHLDTIQRQAYSVASQLSAAEDTMASSNPAITALPRLDSDYDVTLATTGSHRISNQFAVSAAPHRYSAEEMRQMAGELGSLDVGKPKELLAAANSAASVQLADSLQQVRQSQAQIDRLMRQQPSISVASVLPASVGRPLGGIPTSGQFALLTLVSLTIGAVVSLGYRADCAMRPLRTVKQTIRRLRMPVLAAIPAAPTRRTLSPMGWTGRLAGLVVRASEWTLVAVAVVLLLATVFNSAVVAALVATPVEAVAEIVWMIAPRF
jgi:hypothetical protein